MEIRELTVTPREGVGKSVARRLRRSGRTPGILYGGPSPVNIAMDPREVFRIIHGHEGSTQLLKVSFAQTSESRMAIIRDMQFGDGEVMACDGSGPNAKLTVRFRTVGLKRVIARFLQPA